MDKVIEIIFNSQMKTENFLFGLVDPEQEKEEYQQYSFLCNRLRDEEKTALSKYVELSNLRSSEEIKTAYEYGFKTAVKLIIGTLKE